MVFRESRNGLSNRACLLALVDESSGNSFAECKFEGSTEKMVSSW